MYHWGGIKILLCQHQQNLNNNYCESKDNQTIKHHLAVLYTNTEQILLYTYLIKNLQ